MNCKKMSPLLYAGQLYDLNSVWVGIFSLMIMALLLEFVVKRIEMALKME